jgi:predicted MPP superfamily phosphohydrolase
MPGLGPVITNCDLPRSRRGSGRAPGSGWLHVSAGLGSSPYLPVRLACRPEATLVTLVPTA